MCAEAIEPQEPFAAPEISKALKAGQPFPEIAPEGVILYPRQQASV